MQPAPVLAACTQTLTSRSGVWESNRGAACRLASLEASSSVPPRPSRCGLTTPLPTFPFLWGRQSDGVRTHSYHLIFTLITFSKILYLHMLRHQGLNMQIWGAEFSAQHTCAAENREKDPEFVNLNRILLRLSHHSGGCQRVLPGPTVWPGSLGEMQVLAPPPGTTKSESRGPRLRHLCSNKFCRSSLRREIMQAAGPVTHPLPDAVRSTRWGALPKRERLRERAGAGAVPAGGWGGSCWSRQGLGKSAKFLQLNVHKGILTKKQYLRAPRGEERSW